jgi:hypothetical protein
LSACVVAFASRSGDSPANQDRFVVAAFALRRRLAPDMKREGALRTQRQWNASSVRAVTSEIDAALAAQRRDLPLVVDVSALPLRSAVVADASGSASLAAFPSLSRSRFSPPRPLASPPRSFLAVSAAMPQRAPVDDVDHGSTNHSSVRVEWAVPALSQLTRAPSPPPLVRALPGTSRRSLQSPPRTAARSSSPSTRSALNGASASNAFPASPAVFVSMRVDDAPRALPFPPQPATSRATLTSPAPSLASSSFTAAQHHRSPPRAKSFADARPSYFLPTRAGVAHRGLDSLSLERIVGAIDDCPDRDRRAAALRALSGTALDRQSAVFGRAAAHVPPRAAKAAAASVAQRAALAGRSVADDNAHVNSSDADAEISLHRDALRAVPAYAAAAAPPPPHSASAALREDAPYVIEDLDATPRPPNALARASSSADVSPLSVVGARDMSSPAIVFVGDVPVSPTPLQAAAAAAMHASRPAHGSAANQSAIVNDAGASPLSGGASADADLDAALARVSRDLEANPPASAGGAPEADSSIEDML